MYFPHFYTNISLSQHQFKQTFLFRPNKVKIKNFNQLKARFGKTHITFLEIHFEAQLHISDFEYPTIHILSSFFTFTHCTAESLLQSAIALSHAATKDKIN